MEDDSEHLLLQRENIKVTTNRAVINGTIYSITSISAVSITKGTGRWGCLPPLAALTTLAAVGLIGIAGDAFMSPEVTRGVSGFAVGIGFSIAGGIALIISLALIRYIANAKPVHTVWLATNGPQAAGFQTENEALANEVAAALNSAIAQRDHVFR